MGIGKSLRKINYDLGLSKLRDALVKREQEKERDDIYSKISDAYNENVQANSQIPKSQLLDGGTVTNPFMKQPNLSDPFGAMNTSNNILGNAQIPQIQTRPSTQSEIYQKALENKAAFDNIIAPLLMNRNVDNNMLKKVGGISKIISNQTNALAPRERKTKAVDPSKDIINPNTGELIRAGKPKEPKHYAKKYLKDAATGTYVDPLTGESTGVKFEGKTTNSTSKERFEWQKQKDLAKLSEKQKEAQAKYDLGMDSYITIDDFADTFATDDDENAGYDILAQKGYVDKITDEDGNVSYRKKVGGLYLYPDKNKDRLFKTSKELEEFLSKKIYNAPNKWSRNKQKKTKTKILSKSDFVTDFSKEFGRKPTQNEIKRAKGRYWE